MFIGNIATFEGCRMRYLKPVADVVQILKAKNFKNLHPGVYPIEGEEVFFKLDSYTTSIENTHLPETHTRYADIWYIVEGEEELGWCGLNPSLKVKIPYDKEKDVTFYERLLPESSIILDTGSLVLLMPDDVHRGGGAVNKKPATITKVVVKVAIERFS